MKAFHESGAGVNKMIRVKGDQFRRLGTKKIHSKTPFSSQKHLTPLIAIHVCMATRLKKGASPEKSVRSSRDITGGCSLVNGL